jgi:hypothetical protein
LLTAILSPPGSQVTRVTITTTQTPRSLITTTRVTGSPRSPDHPNTRVTGHRSPYTQITRVTKHQGHRVTYHHHQGH